MRKEGPLQKRAWGAEASPAGTPDTSKIAQKVRIIIKILGKRVTGVGAATALSDSPVVYLVQENYGVGETCAGRRAK
jgi:hypothetical protein